MIDNCNLSSAFCNCFSQCSLCLVVNNSKIHETASTEYDCIVIGGGPSGSTTAALVAEAGFRTLLLERDVEPRRKVGESLMPETYWVFERLGVLDAMKNGPFVAKVGVQFVSSSGKRVVAVSVHAARPARVRPHLARGAGQVRSVPARQRREERRRSPSRRPRARSRLRRRPRRRRPPDARRGRFSGRRTRSNSSAPK